MSPQQRLERGEARREEGQEQEGDGDRHYRQSIHIDGVGLGHGRRGIELGGIVARILF